MKNRQDESYVASLQLRTAEGETVPVQAGEVLSVSCDGDYQILRVSVHGHGALSPDAAVTLHIAVPDAPYTAIYNHSAYWMQPRFGERMAELPDQTTLLLVKRQNDYLCLMGAVGDRAKTVLYGAEDGLCARLYTQTEERELTGELSLLIGTGEDPLALIQQGAEVLCRAREGGLRLRAQRPYPEVLEYLGWCSWDAFQIWVSRDGLVEKAEELAEKQVPIHYAIIDDMWADVPNLRTIARDSDYSTMVGGMHASALAAFEGDPERFPGGMGEAVAALRRAGIPHVGLWFPTTGYWRGFLPEGEAYREQQGDLVLSADGKRWISSPQADAVQRYFDRLCRKARDFGCDFVKIDNQGFHGNYYGMAPIGRTAAHVQQAIDAATARYFDGALINCMGMPTECMMNRPTSAVSRCSDDFMPESPAWFAKNILECAYNGLWQGRFYVNDWDMFWTDDAQAVKNAVCHAISGGPIYVSDKLGRTVPQVLAPLAFRDGRILRCEESAVPTADCLIGDPTATGRIFKVRNRIAGAHVLAVFNIRADRADATGAVSAADAGAPAGRYVYYEYFTGEAGEVEADAPLPLTLTAEACRYYTFVPYDGVHPVVLGRTDKYNGRGVVLTDRCGHVTLYEGGPLAIYAPTAPRVTAVGRVCQGSVRGRVTVVELAADEREVEITV